MNPQAQPKDVPMSTSQLLQGSAPQQMGASTALFLEPAGPVAPAAPMQSAPAGQAMQNFQAPPVDTQAVQRTNLQKNIQKLVGDAMGVYDTLFGNLGTAAASQRQALESRFGRETGALGEQFTQEIPRIGQAYAARGAYDSSWRGQAEAQAKQNFENQMQGLQAERMAAGQKLGQEVATQEAQFRGGQAGLNEMLARIPGVTDVNALTEMQAQLQQRINDLRASQAGLQSQEAFMQRFEQLTPSTDRMARLSQTLTNIIRGEAPAPLKQSVGAQIIANSDLTEEEKQQALQNFTSQIATPVQTQVA